MDSTPPEDDAALNDAAKMVIAEMKANPDDEVSLLVQAFIECGQAAVAQGFEGGRLAEREACATIADGFAPDPMDPGMMVSPVAREIASAIRSRR